MEIAAVAVSATDLSRAVAFYEQLGFRFPPLEPDTQHVEAEAGVRLMIDRASLLQELHGRPPGPATRRASRCCPVNRRRSTRPSGGWPRRGTSSSRSRSTPGGGSATTPSA